MTATKTRCGLPIMVTEVAQTTPGHVVRIDLLDTGRRMSEHHDGLIHGWSCICGARSRVGYARKTSAWHAGGVHVGQMGPLPPDRSREVIAPTARELARQLRGVVTAMFAGRRYQEDPAEIIDEARKDLMDIAGKIDRLFGGGQ